MNQEPGGVSWELRKMRDPKPRDVLKELGAPLHVVKWADFVTKNRRFPADNVLAFLRTLEGDYDEKFHTGVALLMTLLSRAEDLRTLKRISEQEFTKIVSQMGVVDSFALGNMLNRKAL